MLKWLKYWCWLVTLSLLMLLAVPQPGQGGHPHIHNFLPEQYGGSNQNWELARTAAGYVYVANNSGLLEYDGSSWRTLTLPGQRSVRSLAIDNDGRIYVGSVGEFGFFEPTEAGKMNYTSQSSKLLERDLPFQDVWTTAVTPSGVFFFAKRYVFRIQGNELDYWQAPRDAPFYRAFEAGGRFFIGSYQEGLLEVANDSLQAVPWADAYTDKAINFIISFKRGYLLGTQQKGLFYQKNNERKPFAVAMPPERPGLVFQQAINLRGDYLALGTANEGTYLYDFEGRLLEHLSEENGLLDNKVFDFGFDGYNTLWMAMNNGISVTSFPNAIEFFTQAEGFNGPIYDIAYLADRLYLATYKGLYYSDNAGRSIYRADDIPHQEIYSIIQHQDQLLIAMRKGIYQLRGGRLRQLSDQRVQHFVASPGYQDRVFCSSKEGVYMLIEERPGRWRLSDNVFPFSLKVSDITIDGAGGVWVLTKRKGLFSVRGIRGQQTPRILPFDTASGLPASLQMGLFAFQGQAYLFNAKRLYALPKTGENIILPAQSLNQGLGSVKGKILKVLPIDEERFLIVTDHPVENYFIFRRAGGSLRPDATILSELDAGEPPLCAYFRSAENQLWMGLDKGFVRVDRFARGPLPRLNAPLIRGIRSQNDSVLYAGMYPLNRYRKLTLPYDQAQQLQFQVTTPGGLPSRKNQIQYYIQGMDQGWGDWRFDKTITLKNLKEGNYKLRLRARDAFGQTSPEQAIQFSVLPPWYRTWWAYLGYLLGFGLLVFAFVRYRVKRVERERKKLARMVERRTEEVTLQKEVLEQAYQEINRQNEDLAAQRNELRDTLEELQNTQAQLVMSEKMAVLGQLVAGVAHEINTPIGVINASSNYAIEGFEPLLRELPQVYEELDAQAREGFWALFREALVPRVSLSTREQRQQRRAIKQQLEADGLPQPDRIAKELVKGNLTENLTSFYDLFRHPKGEKVVGLVATIARTYFHLHNITHAVEKTQKIIKALKSYSFQHSHDELAQANLRENIETVLTINQNALKKLDVQVEAPQDLQPIYCYPDELSQVWTNLINNACYALEGQRDGQIQIQITPEEGWMRVTVADNGPGIPPDVQQRIFDAFYTTKPQGEGTGLGLHICSKIIAKHHGTIEFASEPGHTVFTIYLPVNPQAYEPATGEDREQEQTVASTDAQANTSDGPAPSASSGGATQASAARTDAAEAEQAPSNGTANNNGANSSDASGAAADSTGQAEQASSSHAPSDSNSRQSAH